MSLYDFLRAIVLLEISAVIVFSVAIIAVYIKRLSNPIETHLTWHVISVATGFTVISCGVFYWTFDRIGTDAIHPSIYLFLVGYGAAVVGQYFLYRRQAGHYKRGD